jgi:hypothetical protein
MTTQNTIAMQDLVYTSNPTNILARGRRMENLINYTVISITRYDTPQGSKMVKYTVFCDKIYEKNAVFVVSYGLNGDKTNIVLHPHLAETTFNQPNR